MLLSLIRAVVVSKFAFAASMNEVPLSMIRWRSGPVPLNAAPSSPTVVRRASWSTDSTVVERSPSSFWVGNGTRVSAIAISDRSRRKGLLSVRGWSSTYCSPTAERLPTRARVSAGIAS